jgi:hypothetical protein
MHALALQKLPGEQSALPVQVVLHVVVGDWHSYAPQLPEPAAHPPLPSQVPDEVYVAFCVRLLVHVVVPHAVLAVG